MKKKTGAKNCTTGANCKSTCIAKSKDCIVEGGKLPISAAVSKIKGRESEGLPIELKIFKLKRGSVEAAEAYLKSRMLEGNSHKSKIHALEVPISGGSEAQQKVLRNEVYKYTLTTGHYPEITALKVVPGRSSVDIKNGDIEIKASNNASHLSKSLWHEMAHMLELDPKLKEEAVKFRESNSEGGLKLMSELTGNPGYKDSERGYSSKAWESHPQSYGICNGKNLEKLQVNRLKILFCKYIGFLIRGHSKINQLYLFCFFVIKNITRMHIVVRNTNFV